MLGRISSIAILALIASPALAQATSSVVPEPSSMALFGLGVLGVALGRRFSRPGRD